MKRFIYGLALVIFAGFTACDDMLDIDPISEIPADKYYKNAEQINTAIMGAYRGMQKPLLTEWVLTELRSDNTVQRMPTSTNTQNLDLNDFDMFRPTASNPNIYDYWYATYQNISATNAILGNINVVAAGNQKNQYEGEAKFIRAYHYFNLVRLFGPVFITTEVISPTAARKVNRSPVIDVYDLIIKDLEFGAEKLPAQYDNRDKGRVTQWAAKTLLAKVHLTLGDLGAAKAILLDVKQNSGHGLLTNYADVFSTQNEVNKEIIFAIRFKSGGFGMGSSFANLFAPAQSGAAIVNGDGSGYNYPSPSFMASYEANDARKTATVAVWNENSYVKKYLSTVALRYDAENDWPVLRYSDVLLMLSEIINEENGPEDALPLLNEVRVRAKLPAVTTVESQTECRLLIENERRFEFAFENQRFFDLVRTNRAIEVIGDQIFIKDLAHYNRYPVTLRPNAASIIKNWQLLLPVPQREIDTNNEIIISQNFGY